MPNDFLNRIFSREIMGKELNTYFKVLVCVVLFSLFLPILALADITPEINYQAKLTDDNGAVVANDTYDITFRLYTSPGGPTPIWQENTTVSTVSGLFSILLGQTTSLNGVDFNQTLYLGIEVENDGEMTPRKRLGSVPSAFTARLLNGMSSDQFIHTSTTTLPNITTLSNLSTVGTLTSGTWQGSVVAPAFGGTGTSTLPAFGQLLMGNASGGYDLVATSSLGVSGSRWTLSGSDVYRETGNVGIGTTTPLAKLHVDGDVRFQGVNFATTTIGSFDTYLSISQINLGGGDAPLLRGRGSDGSSTLFTGNTFVVTDLDNINTTLIAFANNNGIGALGFQDNQFALFDPTNTESMKFSVFDDTGSAFFNVDSGSQRVGIGTTTPFAKLTVDGTVAFQGTNFATTTIGSFDTYLSIEEINFMGSKFPLLRGSSEGESVLFTGNLLVLLDIDDSDTGLAFTRGNNFAIFNFSSNNTFSLFGPEEISFVVAGNIMASNLSAGHFTMSSTTATSTIAGNLRVDKNLQIGNSSILLRSGATSTFDGGINLTDGCFAINGVCVGGGGGSSSWTLSGSDVYRETGNVGIGTNNPLRELHVSGTNARILLEETDASEDSGFWQIRADQDRLRFVTVNDAFSTSQEWMTIFRTGLDVDSIAFPNGKVGIGTNSPEQALHINGQLFIQSGGVASRITNSGSNMFFQTGTGFTSSSAKLIFTSMFATTPNLVVDNINNRVGIGTNDPQTKLHVDGGVRFDGSLNMNGNSITSLGGINTDGSVNFQRSGETYIRFSGPYLNIQKDTFFNSNNVTGVGNLEVGDISEIKNLSYSWPSSHTTNGFLRNDGSGNLTWTTAGSGSPAGSDRQIQFNDNDSFGATSSLVWSTLGDLEISSSAPGRGLRAQYINSGRGLGSEAQDSYISSVLDWVGAPGNVYIAEGSCCSIFSNEGHGGNVYLARSGFDADSDPSQYGTSGSVHVGRQNRGGSLHVHSLTLTGAVYSTAPGASGSLLTNINPSSQDYKYDIELLDLNSNRLLDLEIKAFTWHGNDRRDFGLIAEDIKEILPELYQDDGTTKGYDLAKLSFYLIDLAQKQQLQIEMLESQALSKYDSFSDEPLDFFQADGYLSKFLSYNIKELVIDDSGNTITGLLVEDVENNYPEDIKVDSAGGLMVRLPGIWEVVRAIQELWQWTKDRFESQDSRIEALEQRILELESLQNINNQNFNNYGDENNSDSEEVEPDGGGGNLEDEENSGENEGDNNQESEDQSSNDNNESEEFENEEEETFDQNLEEEENEPEDSDSFED